MNFEGLRKEMQGELYTEEAIKSIYATDASAYREIPVAVAIPKSTEDIIRLVHFASENQTSLIPRTAGTSLAGQVVGGELLWMYPNTSMRYWNSTRRRGMCGCSQVLYETS